MSRRLIDCFYPILLAISLAAIVPIPATAGHPIINRSMVPVTDFPPSGSLSQSDCVLISWGAIEMGASHCGRTVTGGTHDSVPAHRIASLSPRSFAPVKLLAKSLAKPHAKVVSPVAPVEVAGVTESVSIPTAIMAVACVRVQQMVEPFAMVGPRLVPSRKSLTEFLDWCNQIAELKIAETEIVKTEIVEVDEQAVAIVPDRLSPVDQIVSIDRILDSLTADEPVDAHVNRVEIRNYVESIDRRYEAPSIAVAKIDPLVGSSAMIATLGSGPFAGDVASNSDVITGELRIWSVFPTVTRPFCVRHQSQCLRSESLDMIPEALSRRIDDDVDHMAEIGNVEWMLADARASLPDPIIADPIIADPVVADPMVVAPAVAAPAVAAPTVVAANLAQPDGLSEAASATVAMAQDLGQWVLRQDAAAKQLVWQRASRILQQTSIAEPVSPDSLQGLGRNFAQWTLAGKEIASSAAKSVAKKMPSRSEPAAAKRATAKLAATEIDSDRQ